MKTVDLTLSRTIAASPDEIFDVWLDPRSPGGPWFGAKRVLLTPVVDGLFYVAVEDDGRMYPHYGRFVTLEKPRLIEHTWMSEGTKGLESVVTITLESRSGKTEVTLRHSGVPDDEDGRRHQEGWDWILGMLEQGFAARAAAKGQAPGQG